MALATRSSRMPRQFGLNFTHVRLREKSGCLLRARSFLVRRVMQCRPGVRSGRDDLSGHQTASGNQRSGRNSCRGMPVTSEIFGTCQGGIRSHE